MPYDSVDNTYVISVYVAKPGQGQSCPRVKKAVSLQYPRMLGEKVGAVPTLLVKLECYDADQAHESRFGCLK